MQNISLKQVPSQSLQKVKGDPYPIWKGELWTSKQRQMNPLHYAISYRASFKPELPDFFIHRYLLSKKIKQGIVLDTFGGRGTTALQANLLGFSAIHNDLNPVSIFIARARQHIPSLKALTKRTQSLVVDGACTLSKREEERLLPFFHPRTLNEILNIRQILLKDPEQKDPELSYIGLTLLSRLHGHSDGFLSVYSFPQISILPIAQIRNNKRLGLRPKYKAVKPRIIRKMTNDMRHVNLSESFYSTTAENSYLQNSACHMPSVKTGSVDLLVTSPPFLNKVDYELDNWMRAWFLGQEEQLKHTPLSIIPDLTEWCDFMQKVMKEMGRVLKLQGHAVIEVGEVSIKDKNQNLEEQLASRLPLEVGGGVLQVKEIFINEQSFTKLSNCWSVSNNHKGTNSNRCLVLQKV